MLWCFIYLKFTFQNIIKEKENNNCTIITLLYILENILLKMQLTRKQKKKEGIKKLATLFL